MIIAKSMKLEVESRILTEQDLLDWLAQTLPIGKSLLKSRNKNHGDVDLTQGITDDGLDMKFGRELHSLVIGLFSVEMDLVLNCYNFWIDSFIFLEFV